MLRRVLSLFLACLWTLTAASTDYRLPGNVVPVHYKLEILTFLGEQPSNFDYNGKVWIQIRVLEATTNITLHAKKLNITEDQVTVRELKGKRNRVDVSKIKEQENDFLVLHLTEPLKKDREYEVYIPFVAQLLDGLAGFYKSSYTDKATKEKKWLGVTQFEAISARKAFPCFDEPSMKATFQITLGRKEGYSSISNMPLHTSEPIKEKEGWYWDKYENSVPMSTYLVAFIVSDFGYKVSEESEHNNVTFKIWSRKDALDQVDFAKDVGPKFLEYYEKFFDIAYPLPKQDMVAIPDFSAGAMENWGLITYREAYLLFDPEVSSTTSQHSVASVIAHELAHQWFGNLVTMKWWTDLWLNEGFATYMAGLAVHHQFPQWNSLKEEAVNNLLNVFSFDSLKTSHPVSVPIGHPNEIDEIFDTISYKKGSFLIRMMSLFLGKETLRKGVSNYLTTHKYGNAEQDDLWSSLTHQAHKNGVLPKNLTVKTVMDTWTLQTGYPVIKVARDYEKDSATITQERFLRDAVKQKESDPCWWVPLSYTCAAELDFKSALPKAWLSCPKEPKTIEDVASKDDWLIFNIDVSGLYKINYDEKNWRMLAATLNSENYKDIPVLNRVQLIDDASDLARTEDLSYEVVFKLYQYLKYENEYLAWKGALSNINYINKQLKWTPVYGTFKTYMRRILTPIYEKLGGLELSRAKSTKLDAIKFQVLIINWACKFEVAGCIADAKRQFEGWMLGRSGENPIPKDLRSAIYCTAVRTGGDKEWDFIWNQYKKSNVATEKSTMLGTLGCTREFWLLNRYLDWSLNEESGIRRQDSTAVFGSVAGTDVGYQVAKNFLYSKVDKIYKHLSVDSKRMSRYLTSIANHMTQEKEYQEFQRFINDHKKYLSQVKQGVDQSLETARLNVQWQSLHLENVEKILGEFVKAGEQTAI